MPAARAQAQSAPCAKAVELVNAAVAMSGGSLDAATSTALSHRLRVPADLAQGEEKRVITAYADALIDEIITDLDPYTDELNRFCGTGS
ncbi:hypothetical protein D5S18_00425 [Nocardia panacis]|uniref:Uncharacterized protein n=2 Tax=Nocardia panacis TaxID=2340916 RepID=A0A3A4KDK1_9NOCA|nr:hypothetical protein D5S18_00425 [Nocardia panacis]